MSKQWLVAHPRREAPTSVPDHPVFETWRRYVGEITPGNGDFEYFTEEAFRLHSAIHSFGASNTWLHHQWGEKEGIALNAATGEERSAVEMMEHGAHIYGAQVMKDRHALLAGEKADDYSLLSAFRKNSGRYLEPGGFATDDGKSLTDIFSRMHDRGITKAILKRRHRKNPLIIADLSGWGTKSSVHSALGEDDMWSMIYDEGVQDAYLVQEFVPMRFEYRTFIIDHEPVTGAGCVEEFTPLDNQGDAFDARLREFRDDGEGSLVRELPEFRDKLLAFVRDVSEEIRKESPDIGGYTLDTALDAQGNPLVIELNGHLNSGFYACQPHLVTDAIARAADR